MIGYIQKHDFDHWLATINGWVDELIAESRPDCPWDMRDKLQRENESLPLCWLRSDNLRVSDNQRLTIRHIWVRLGQAFTSERSAVSAS